MLAGCASILGIDDGKPYPLDGGEDGTTSDGASDAQKEVEVPPDVNIEANTATCDDFTRSLVDGGVYMSPTGTDNGNCSQQQPCQHWSAAVPMAQMRNAPIYLMPGDYTKAVNGNLVLSSGTVFVEGGWLIDGGAWQPVCDFTAARIHGAHPVITGQTAVIAEQNTTLTLRLVSVVADPIASTGSSYGVFGNASTRITLEAVVVHAGIGVAGGNGAGNNQGSFSNCTIGNMGMGGAGASGNASGAFYTSTGYVLSAGTYGSPGEAGGGGGPGMDGGSTSCNDCIGSMTPDGSTCTPTVTMIYGGTGSPGCGGGGGGGGSPGIGAAASIGVYVTGGALVIKSGSLITSVVGAAGGNGAMGLGGQGGSTGGSGSMSGMSTGVCNANLCTNGGSCIAEGGAGGSPGGTGGAGGRGGGGSGGASIALVRANAVQLDVRDGSTLVWSNGGDGGLPNGQAGDQGRERGF